MRTYPVDCECDNGEMQLKSIRIIEATSKLCPDCTEEEKAEFMANKPDDEFYTIFTGICTKCGKSHEIKILKQKESEG